jgi:hypothetical protein
VLDCSYSLRYDFGSQRLPRFAIPENVTRASLGRKMMGRLEERNFLCEYVYNCQWERQTRAPANANVPTLFDRPLARELHLVQHNNPLGFIHMGDLLNPAFTEMQQVVVLTDT